MDFYKAKSKAKKIRQQRSLLLGYAIVVTAGFFVSLYANVEASTPKNIDLSELAADGFGGYDADIAASADLKVDDGNFAIAQDADFDADTDGAETIADAAINESAEQSESVAQAESEVINENPLQVNEEIVTVAKGDSFIGILTKMGLDYSKATDIYTTLKKVYDARHIKVGQDLQITSTFDTQTAQLASIDKIVIEPISGTRYIVERNDEGKYSAHTEQDSLTDEVKAVNGVVNGSLAGAMRSAGVPSNVVGNFINIFSFSVDFRRDMRAGDEFEVRYERRLAPDGTVVKTGEIIYAALKLRNDKIELYRFKDKNGNVDYYNEKGIALKKSLDRKPMEYKRARVSSPFGRRFHPILKVYKHHDGVDYAAPTGSKVYASADGVITASKWYGGYGNYITIRHNSEYSTGYGHLKSFAKGIRPGVRVKQGQVIAYVGNTGRSTGPHLHFEVIKNGVKVNPLKVKAATGENLSGAKLAAFKKVVAEIKASSLQSKEIANRSQSDEIGNLIDESDTKPENI